MKVKVIYTLWAADGFDEPLGGGVHELDALNEDQYRAVASAAAGGALEIVGATAAERKLLEPHVQSQEDGEAAQAAAFASGDWHIGNLQNYIATSRARLEAEGSFEPGDKLRLSLGIVEAAADLAARTGEPVDAGDAAREVVHAHETSPDVVAAAAASRDESANEGDPS